LRRKILVGAIVLAKVEDQSFDEAVLKQWLDAALTWEDDPALFGFRGRQVWDTVEANRTPRARLPHTSFT